MSRAALSSLRPLLPSSATTSLSVNSENCSIVFMPYISNAYGVLLPIPGRL